MRTVRAVEPVDDALFKQVALEKRCGEDGGLARQAREVEHADGTEIAEARWEFLFMLIVVGPMVLPGVEVRRVVALEIRDGDTQECSIWYL